MPTRITSAFKIGARLRVVGEDSGRYQGAEGPFVRFRADARPTWWKHGERWPYGVDLTHAGIPGVTGVRFFGRSEVELCQNRQSTSARPQVPAAKRVTAAKRPAKKR